MAVNPNGKNNAARAALAGAALGAAAGAAAVIFSKKENREKAKKKATDLKKMADEKSQMFRKKIEETNGKGELDKKITEAKAKLDEVKHDMEST